MKNLQYEIREPQYTTATCPDFYETDVMAASGGQISRPLGTGAVQKIQNEKYLEWQ